MRRFLLCSAFVAALVGLSVGPVLARVIMRPQQPDRLALTTPVVVTGKVTSIEAATVDAPSADGGTTDKVAYKVAVVKLDKALVGADNVTHVRIGFVPPAAPNANPGPGPGGIRPGRGPLRPGIPLPELKAGQESLFFLAKHPTADFYVMPRFSPPIDIAADAGKKQLDEVVKALAVVADPLKGLKSDKADVRLDTAAKLLTKYRAYPVFGGEVDEVAVPADESKLILKVIAAADWKGAAPAGPIGRPGLAAPNGLQAFYQLGLTDKDGWQPPQFPQPQPGAPPVDFVAIQKEAFVKWLDGPGKDYVVKKVVEKKK
jgi:hypothetical protein